MDLRIVEPGTDDELPWDGEARGELQARGPWIAAGYYNDDRSSDSFTEDGWLRTGDVATISPNGYVRLVDRTKDLVKSGGEWISSVELENAIMAHPKVAEAAVIGIPDEKWSERPLACVVPEGDEEITLDELKAFLAERVPKWWIPNDLEIIDEVPKTSVGKFSKKTLREQFAEQTDDRLMRSDSVSARLAWPRHDESLLVAAAAAPPRSRHRRRGDHAGRAGDADQRLGRPRASARRRRLRSDVRVARGGRRRQGGTRGHGAPAGRRRGRRPGRAAGDAGDVHVPGAAHRSGSRRRLGLVQETGGHAIVTREACRPTIERALDPCETKWVDIQRDGPGATTRDRGAQLAISFNTEPDADGDLRGDLTEDRTDLRVSAVAGARAPTGACGST